MINGIVDFPKSADQHRPAVKMGVDLELDNLKRTYDGMDDLLTEVARRFEDDLPEWARQYISNCIFYPQLGFLTVVPLDPQTGAGMYEGEGMSEDAWSKMFSTENMCYYKNRRMREMDEFFGDLYGMICGK